MTSNTFVARRASIPVLDGEPEIEVSTLRVGLYLSLVFRRERGMPHVVMVSSTADDDPIQVGVTTEHRELRCFSCVVSHGDRSWIGSWPKTTTGGPSAFSVTMIG